MSGGAGAFLNACYPRLSGFVPTDHAPHFPLKHQAKDLDFTVRLAKKLGVSTKVAAAASAAYQEALAESGDLDFSAVIKPMVEQGQPVALSKS